MPLSPWQSFQKKWKTCTRCSLCEKRKNVVLARGPLPADILFVGESPGESEDVAARPFHGPAGKLLDTQVTQAGLDHFRRSYTNIVACIPKVKKETGKTGKAEEPPKECIIACRERLAEFIELVQPRAIVKVGKLSDKWTPEALNLCQLAEQPLEISVIHPSAILQADISQKPYAHQQNVVALRELGDDLET